MKLWLSKYNSNTTAIVADYCIVTLVVEEHDEETFEGSSGVPSQFSCFVEKLPTCMSKQMVDEVCA